MKREDKSDGHCFGRQGCARHWENHERQLQSLADWHSVKSDWTMGESRGLVPWAKMDRLTCGLTSRPISIK